MARLARLRLNPHLTRREKNSVHCLSTPHLLLHEVEFLWPFFSKVFAFSARFFPGPLFLLVEQRNHIKMRNMGSPVLHLICFMALVLSAGDIRS